MKKICPYKYNVGSLEVFEIYQNFPYTRNFFFELKLKWLNRYSNKKFYKYLAKVGYRTYQD